MTQVTLKGKDRDPNVFEVSISKSAGDRNSITMDNMAIQVAYGESNGQVLDDVTWPYCLRRATGGLAEDAPFERFFRCRSTQGKTRKWQQSLNLLTAVFDHVVEHRSSGGNSRQIQHDLVVVANELFQLSTSVDRQKNSETPEKREDVETLISVVLSRHLSERQQAVK